VEWHVQYRAAGIEHIVMHPSPELAIEAACRPMDEGDDVFAIRMGSLDDSIDRDQVARIYAIWTRGKSPFGR
jgi:hypothetical protein